MALLRYFISLLVLSWIAAGPAVGVQQQAGNQSSHDSTRATAYDKAFRLLQSGKNVEALAEIDAGLTESPRNATLHNLRGLVTSQLGRKSEAEASFRKVIALLPNAAMGYNNLGIFLAGEGRLPEAEHVFQTALKLEPENFTALLGLGVTLATLRRNAEALPHLEKARAARPQDFQAGYECARVLRELKRPAEAQRVLGGLARPKDAALASKYFALFAVVSEDRNDMLAAERLFRQANDLAPDSFDIYLSLARIQLRSSPTSARHPLPAPPRDLSAEQHFGLGLMFASHNQWAEAIPHFEATLQMEPSSVSATYNLALAYRGATRRDDAIGLLTRAVEQRPNAELTNLLASLEENAGRYLDAVRHFRAAVDLDPENEQYYFDLGAEYLVHFTFDPALEVFAAGVRRFPAASRQFVGLGMAYSALRQYPEAAEAFLRALETDPASPSALSAWNSLPSFLAPGDWERVLPRLRQLAEKQPANADILFSFGSSLFRYSLSAGKSENFGLAQSFLERAIQLKPGYADAHLELGAIYSARKENTKSVARFQETVRLNPGSEMGYYRLGQTYRDMGELALAQQALSRYADLARGRRERLARSRAAIKQFILAQSPAPSNSLRDRTLPPQAP